MPSQKFGLSRPCFICKSGAHITPLCSSNKNKVKREVKGASTSSAEAQNLEDECTDRNNLCINTGNTSSDQILPTMSLKIRNGNKTVSARVLLDLGSQRSYFNCNILEKLALDVDSLPVSTSVIKTF